MTLDFYKARRENGFYIWGEQGAELRIPQEDIVSVAIQSIQPHKGPHTRRKK